ncbi:hypothetical protein ACVNIS_07475 [Sphaerotilaceae bacterium SBD11-9]
MKAKQKLSRPFAARWFRLGLAAGAVLATLPAVAAGGFHGHSSHTTGVHHAPAPPPLTAARVHEVGEQVRHSPMPEVRPPYYAMPHATSAFQVRSQSIPLQLAKVELKTPERPDFVTHVGGNGSPRVAFNRRSVGGASGTDSVRRDDAYRLADNRPARGATPEQMASRTRWRRLGHFQNNSVSVKLPETFAGSPATYVSHKPRKEPHESLTMRHVIAKHPHDLKPGALKGQATGAGYMSRHYGDRQTGVPHTAPFELVVRIQ